MPKNVELLDNTNDKLYPKTKAEQVIVTSTKNLDVKLTEVDTKIKDVTDEVVNARPDKKGVSHPTLKARLDAMEDTTTTINNTVNSVKQEVEQARGGEANLNDRLDKMTTATTNAQNTATQAQQTANTANNTVNSVKQEIDNAKAPNGTLKEKIDGIDNKFGRYLPLTGGTVAGNLEVNGNLTNGGFDVWHEGNLVPHENAIPDTVVKRSGTGSIATGQILNFQDATQTRIGGIALDQTTRELRHNYIPTGSSQQTAYNIWTERNLKVESGDFTPVAGGTTAGTLVTRNAKGQYVRIGNTVTFHLEINLFGAGSAQGNLQISGLPYVSGSNVGKSCSIGWLEGMSPGCEFYAYMSGGANSIRILQRTIATGATGYLTAGAAVQNPQNPNGNAISISGTYRINA